MTPDKYAHLTRGRRIDEAVRASSECRELYAIVPGIMGIWDPHSRILPIYVGEFNITPGVPFTLTYESVVSVRANYRRIVEREEGRG